jgi:hypothetical protein
MSSLIYNAAKAALLDGGIDLLNDALKVALVGAAYTPDPDAHETFADISGEVSGAGYAAGGQTLTGRTVVRDDINDRAAFDAADLTWATAAFSARGAVLYADSGDPATSPLVAYIDFGYDYGVNGENFLVEWHADGVLTLP